jgi:hypothetical protein
MLLLDFHDSPAAQFDLAIVEIVNEHVIVNSIGTMHSLRVEPEIRIFFCRREPGPGMNQIAASNEQGVEWYGHGVSLARSLKSRTHHDLRPLVC